MRHDALARAGAFPKKMRVAPRTHPAAHAPIGFHRSGRRLQQVRMSSAPLAGSTSYAIDPASY